ncbi:MULTISPECIES: DUF3105 domain-containing protein [Streptomycetaceae]|uniref:DUF3105 domain-containing protein n=1 Tax=Streptantibioticus cattleyicolor (strain ATCC 35852 / DSM 46488 / JCM 4925 / NBRC 14057 / NRRL 8057) TaxID=1003195 RepID=F8K3H4_STREN|nr:MULTISPECIES: DUF3105 domain-containing protein [Streptomycetaceae]AEW95102.1 hypothetical protein SCATT_27310 [Streptantibioticus cattleyicolor NRRL 8057 = DSM 46488]MYS59691.1 DUF3105 domain-containing protein [Streptomyces sp. SID5468]CCB75448.1 conserved exported protein of unknown function [Streptantibioticus cattleyicolor NRRL 8057 = DSM 46488]
MSSAKARGSEERRRKIAEQRAAQKRQQRRRKIVTWTVGGVLLAAVAGGGAFAVLSQKSASQIAGVRSFSGLGRNHVTGTVKYAQTPPVGGNHASVWLNCGIYNAPVPNENAVHSMEHGAVWITYRPSLPAADVSKLAAAVRGKAYTLLSPYPGLPAPVVASAWGKQLKLTDASDARLAKFVHTYAAGPQTPEPGAPCTGGTGTPTG